MDFDEENKKKTYDYVADIYGKEVAPGQEAQYGDAVRRKDLEMAMAKEPTAMQKFAAGFSGRSMDDLYSDQKSAQRQLAAMDQKKKQDKEDAARAEEDDPNSEISKMYQGLLKPMFPGKDLSKLSASRSKAMFPDAANAYKTQQDKIKAAKESDDGFSQGEKQLDKDFAKDYNDWTSGGAKIARNEIEKLKTVAKRLKDEDVTTGGFTGMFPDRITSDEVLSARSDVSSTVMNSLKALLGAQFTEKEGERVIKNTWNESDTTENNLARVNRLIEDLESKANDKDSKSKYFEQNRGLKNYKSGIQAPGNEAAYDPEVVQTQGGRTSKTISAPSTVETKTINGKTYRKVKGGWEEVI